MDKKYYSQNGEDKLLWSLFNDQTDGIFVDIGAHNGLVLSNTLSFEEQGWKGLCAEAHPNLAKQCMTNRRAIVVHAAVGKEDKESVSFFATNMGHLSTLDKSMETYFKAAYKKHFTGFQEVKVPMRTVNTMLDKCNFDHIDFISIDVEGSELDVIIGLDLEKYRPRVILSEAMQQVHEKMLREYLEPKKYIYARKTGNNLFFCRDKNDVNKLQGKH